MTAAQPMGSDTWWWWGTHGSPSDGCPRPLAHHVMRDFSRITRSGPWLYSGEQSGHSWKTGPWGAGTSLGQAAGWGKHEGEGSGDGGTRHCPGSRPVPHPRRCPAAAPSAPALSARGRRVPPRARCGAAPRFWRGHRLHGETAWLAPAAGLRPPNPHHRQEVGGTRGGRTGLPGTGISPGGEPA